MVIYTSPHLHQTAMWMAGLEIISITLRQVSMGTSATQCISPHHTHQRRRNDNDHGDDIVLPMDPSERMSLAIPSPEEVHSDASRTRYRIVPTSIVGGGELDLRFQKGTWTVAR
jgi:hypothetical protein